VYFDETKSYCRDETKSYCRQQRRNLTKQSMKTGAKGQREIKTRYQNTRLVQGNERVGKRSILLTMASNRLISNAVETLVVVQPVKVNIVWKQNFKKLENLTNLGSVRIKRISSSSFERVLAIRC